VKTAGSGKAFLRNQSLAIGIVLECGLAGSLQSIYLSGESKIDAGKIKS
jgi:hypothetical protein